MKKKTTKSSLNEPVVYCRYTEMREISTLKENPRNPNKHPQFQLERLAEIIKGNGWRQPVTVSDLSGLIVKGHGRYQAAKLAGFTQIPVEVQHYETEAEEMADLLADNKIAELAEMDEEAVSKILNEIQESGLPIGLTGFTLEDIEAAAQDADEAISESKYNEMHTGIIYQPKGEKPALSECVRRDKTIELVNEIRAAENVTDEEKQFLIDAAQRHLQFSYSNVAEYYCHATPEMQRLMERSALVIIDFEQAIEDGYIRLRKKLLELREKDGVRTAVDEEDDEEFEDDYES